MAVRTDDELNFSAEEAAAWEAPEQQGQHPRVTGQNRAMRTGWLVVVVLIAGYLFMVAGLVVVRTLDTASLRAAPQQRQVTSPVVAYPEGIKLVHGRVTIIVGRLPHVGYATRALPYSDAPGGKPIGTIREGTHVYFGPPTKRAHWRWVKSFDRAHEGYADFMVPIVADSEFLGQNQ